MIHPAIKNEFLIRYYQWALIDSKREYQDGFPFLNKIRSKTILRLFDFIEGLSQEEKERFRLACVKRFHLEALGILKESLSASEMGLIERFLSTNLVECRYELEKLALLSPFRTTFKTDQRKFKKILKVNLEKVLGPTDESFGKSSWYYRIPIKDWTLVTLVKPDKPPMYFHSIQAAPHICLVEGVNILSWLGINSMTHWDFMTNDDLDVTAQTIAGLCSHFFKSAVPLLDGLINS